MNEEFEQLIAMTSDESLTDKQRGAARFAIEMMTTVAAEEQEENEISLRNQELENQISSLRRTLDEYRSFAGITELAYRTLCSKVPAETLPVTDFSARQGGDPASEGKEVGQDELEVSPVAEQSA